MAVSGLLVLLSAQFKTEDFSAGGDMVSVLATATTQWNHPLDRCFGSSSPTTRFEVPVFDFTRRTCLQREPLLIYS